MILNQEKTTTSGSGSGSGSGSHRQQFSLHTKTPPVTPTLRPEDPIHEVWAPDADVEPDLSV